MDISTAKEQAQIVQSEINKLIQQLSERIGCEVSVSTFCMEKIGRLQREWVSIAFVIE